MKDNNVVQLVTNGFAEKVDNLVLQRIIKITEDAKIKDEEMLRFQLNKCEFSGRQRIFFDAEEDEEREDVELCMFCQKPVNEVALVYRYTNDKKEVTHLYCLESEGEELLQQQQ